MQVVHRVLLNVLGSLLVLSLVVMLAFWAAPRSPRAPHIWVRGSVLDVNDRAIAGARVVVQLVNEYGLTGYEQRFIACTTGPDGRFDIKLFSPISVDTLSVAASTVENQYAEQVFGDYQEKAITVSLHPEPLPEKSANDLWMRFEHFTGQGIPTSPWEIVFLGPNWNLEPAALTAGDK